MIPVQQIAYVTYETPDLKRLADYYSEVVGFDQIHSDKSSVVLASSMGNETLLFQQGAQCGCTRKSFQISPDCDLSEIASHLTKKGIQNEIRSDVLPSIGKAILFKDPIGTQIELFTGFRQPSPRREAHGIGPLKLGHIAFNVSSPSTLADFYCGVLGFRVSDWMEDFFVFLRCNADHHTVNFRGGPVTGVDHLAFELKDWSHVQAACDVLARHRRPILWGPIRHSIGHNIAVYHRDPDGNMIELYTEMDQMKSEALGYFDLRPWHHDWPQRPKVWSREEAATMWGVPSAPDYSRHRQQTAS
jgi:catechol-2,3-dioxygenase